MNTPPPTHPSGIRLGVNIDHCATLREARYRQHPRTRGGPVEPDPVTFALLCERAGADGITVHLREDRRHIQEHDVRLLRECLQTRLNLEMACTGQMLEFALSVQPECVCLVPENRLEVTTEGGLAVAGHEDRVRSIVDPLLGHGIAVSLFIDPDPSQIEAAAAVGAPWVELHTGAMANAWGSPRDRETEMRKLREGAALAHRLGLRVNAGHGINYHNIVEVRLLPHLQELNIGHSILSRALISGIEEAVREMKRRIQGGS